MNVHVSVGVFILPISTISGSYGSSVFNFWESAVQFAIVAVPFYIPTDSAQGFQCFHILVSTYYILIVTSLMSVRCQILALKFFSLHWASSNKKLETYQWRRKGKEEFTFYLILLYLFSMVAITNYHKLKTIQIYYLTVL